MTRKQRFDLTQILIGSVSALTVGGLAIWALGVNHGGGTPPQEVYSTDRKPVAEGLNTLPRDDAAETKRTGGIMP